MTTPQEHLHTTLAELNETLTQLHEAQTRLDAANALLTDSAAELDGIREGLASVQLKLLSYSPEELAGSDADDRFAECVDAIRGELARIQISWHQELEMRMASEHLAVANDTERVLVQEQSIQSEIKNFELRSQIMVLEAEIQLLRKAGLEINEENGI